MAKCSCHITSRFRFLAFQVPKKYVEIQKDLDTISKSIIPSVPMKKNKNLLLHGNYSITKDDMVIDKVSYNFDRQESILTYSNPNNWDNTNLYNNVGDLFDNIALDNKINSFWKWFVILALLFLLIELVILKFYK